jgi:hypothetical protein
VVAMMTAAIPIAVATGDDHDVIAAMAAKVTIPMAIAIDMHLDLGDDDRLVGGWRRARKGRHGQKRQGRC